MWFHLQLLLATVLIFMKTAELQEPEEVKLDWNLGPCKLQLYETCDDMDIIFYYFPSVGSTPEVLNTTNPEPSASFSPERPTKVIIHGYTGNVDYNVTAEIRNEYLRKGGNNIIVLDWGTLVIHPCYATAVLNTWQAGKCTAELLVALKSRFHTFKMSDVHAIGFSLGAHVSAYASNDIEKQTGERLGRITGLDPALPLFVNLDKSWKLDASDANFVDIIHSNVGIYGKVEATGHVDFYANGGKTQPACVNETNINLCNHHMAPRYYAESISSDVGFWAVPCPGYITNFVGSCSENVVNSTQKVLMGDPCELGTTGVYFVSTNAEPPYAQGRYV